MILYFLVMNNKRCINFLKKIVVTSFSCVSVYNKRMPRMGYLVPFATFPGVFLR